MNYISAKGEINFMYKRRKMMALKEEPIIVHGC